MMVQSIDKLARYRVRSIVLGCRRHRRRCDGTPNRSQTGSTMYIFTTHIGIVYNRIPYGRVGRRYVLDHSIEHGGDGRIQITRRNFIPMGSLPLWCTQSQCHCHFLRRLDHFCNDYIDIGSSTTGSRIGRHDGCCCPYGMKDKCRPRPGISL